IRVELGAQIGQGAFGKVFIGANIDTGELMAVKQVPGGIEGPQQKKSSDSLEREIAFLSQLNHDNIVRYIGMRIPNFFILGFDSVDGNFNVYLEYVSGGTVASGIAQYGKFDETITRSFTAQILCGLEYLHDRDIIHRDIKGANVLVTSEGVAKISDFGISKKNEYAAYHRMTRLSFQGTVPWMAPEVARGKGYSAKVDIWSCGCLVLEMLSGKLPWHNVRGQVIYLLGTGNAPPIPPSIADAPREFISTTFEIDPEKRPTASDLLDHPF
ncbi:kinase-like domain-containing protein, partial [Globomyces pollinis-pini]